MAIAKKASKAAANPAPQFHVVGKEPPSDGLDFGGLDAPTAPPAGASDKPIVKLEGEGLELMEQYAEHAPEYKRLEKLVGSKGSLKAQLAAHIRRAYFTHFSGRTADASTLLTSVRLMKGGVDTKQMSTIKLVFKEQYAKTCAAIAAIAAAVPNAAKHFRMVSVVKIEFDKLPADKQQPLINLLVEFKTKNGITDGITASKCVQPVAGFHESRHTLFTPEENILIDEIIPITAYPQV